MIWRQAASAIIEIPKPYDNHGWTKEGGNIVVSTRKDPTSIHCWYNGTRTRNPSEDDEDDDEEWQANITTEEAYNSEYDSAVDESESD